MTPSEYSHYPMWYTVGHDWAITLLERSVRNRRVAHSYLFTGQDGLGKTHLARQLAAMLNCTADAPPCGACHACTRIARDAHPDVHLVRPVEGRIKIDQVRAVQHDLALSPYEGRWRVAILADFHTATVEAGNALLKTLEEPPSRAVVVLTAVDPGLLLPTVVSRCQVLAVRAVPRERIAEALEEHWHLEGDRARLLAALSAGRIEWAIRAAEDPDVLTRRREDLQLLLDLLHGGRAERILAAEELAGREDLGDLLRLWQSWWRDLVLLAGGGAEYISNLDRLDVLRGQAEALGLAAAGAGARAVTEALERLDQNVNARLALEALLLGWPSMVPAAG